MFSGTHVQSRPDKPAVIMAGSGRTTTYCELETRSGQLAWALHRLGLRKGDVVALLSDNSPEAFEVYWAAVRSGLYITALNWHLAADEVAYILVDSGATAVIASAGVRPLAEQVAASVPSVAHWYAFGGEIDGFGNYGELLESAGASRLADRPRGTDMLYSSGTTGRPKGVKPRLPKGQVDEEADPISLLLQHAFGMGAEDVYLSPAPIYHAAPLKWSAAVQAIGGTVVMLDRFDAEATLAAIENFGVTSTQMVPTMYIRMLQLPDSVRAKYDVSSLRIAVHGAAPCPPDVKDAMIAWWGPILVEYYGATEGHGSTVITTEDWREKRGSVGKAVLGDVHICDDSGAELPAGAVGTIYFERDEAPFEYHNDAEKTAESRHPEHPNWTTVGDVGYCDDEGYLFLTDRKGFMIISGGVNIYPQEVENVLAMHPSILDVAVIGAPDTEMGQQVKAVVQLRDGVAPSDELADHIIGYARERIAHFKAPRSVDFVECLPRLATGKLAKRALVDRYLEVNR
ncbi:MULTISPECIES: acyl-CoA synthetase [unclassified Mycobacterium]|uniref:acyl-CoA synthetase n=1 Tax=unclassified Mycobacterium TaxID=2642494 RepID=UPI0007404919|nr:MULTISPECIES: acyl-CoA synthetase [unclassified Mycobacterium]KUH83113.1 acyl-CoA synthetase [Mycobacterium sp. GA-0227b]KUH84476.1 acyl-CoA synthetase [Mycobacterium sp. GA-1999]KUH89388.1 acyl-CoA synthetase [Mycobacterium sp. IS-1556]